MQADFELGQLMRDQLVPRAVLYYTGEIAEDDDFEGDHCDLDDGLIYIRFKKKNTVLWQDEAGFDSWNLYRGDFDVLADQGVYTQLPGSNALAAHQCGLVEAKADDPLTPPYG